MGALQLTTHARETDMECTHCGYEDASPDHFIDGYCCDCVHEALEFDLEMYERESA